MDERKNESLNNVAFQTLQRPEPKMFGKREENGVSTPHVLSMRPYAHIQAVLSKNNFEKSSLILKDIFNIFKSRHLILRKLRNLFSNN